MRRLDLRNKEADERASALGQQWLVTNGLGGFASGTLAGTVNWRYHGVLVAALPGPLGRTVMLSQVAEAIELADGQLRRFGGGEAAGAAPFLAEFRLEHHLPVWRHEIDGIVIEKRVLMPNLQNTVHVMYRLLEGPAKVRLRLEPFLHFRALEESVRESFGGDYRISFAGPRADIIADGTVYPPLRLLVEAGHASFTFAGGAMREVHYEHDAQRGYESRGVLWSPGYWSVTLTAEAPVVLTASTEEWRTLEALDPATALATETERRARLLRLAQADEHGAVGELVLAADQFLISPVGRARDAAIARARGDELRSVIAGYHWFTDWGRDTMISLEGLTLSTGRWQEAAWILRAFAHYVRDGLIPNLFPEGRSEGLYHTADATLWFFHAVHRYVQVTQDQETLRGLLPILREIVAQHVRGTRFGIGVDPADGLLRQGEEGYQLTWMDAKVGDWVVTPRRGKAVELNALWYNALRLLSTWLEKEGDADAAAELARHAERNARSFQARFWNDRTGCLFDVVDGPGGDDPAIRPNQILAIALEHPVLGRERWAAVLDVAQRRLLTPVGLRSLSADHPDYKPSYSGDLRARDAAYHQGTVWAWLIGPFVDAWLKVHAGDRRGARAFLEGFLPHLNEGCIGSISEVFDAEPPFAQRGCIAQAWSVAEVLRCLKRVEATGEETGPDAPGGQSR